MPSAASSVKHDDGVNDYDDAEKNYQPKSLKFWAIIIGMYMAVFLVALDRTIIATAIPKITDEFNSIEDIGWYGSAYMLTGACFYPIFGRIYQLYSTKWTFLASIVIFEVGSTICGAAPTSTALIAGRAVAGLGASGILSGGMLIIFPIVPLRKRPIFNSIFGVAFGISSVLGPIVGGTFTDKVTWRWCFYLNLPIGGSTLVAMFLFLHLEPKEREQLPLIAQIKRLDPVGIFFFMPSMVCLILTLQWGGSVNPWSSPRIIGLLVASGVMFLIFLVVEVLTPGTAMVPTHIVLNRSIAGTLTYMFVLSGGMMSVVFYLTAWFQAVKGDSAMRAGISTIPLVLCMTVMSIAVAKFTERIGYYVPAMLLAPVFCSIGAGLMMTLTPSSNHSYWIGYQALYGIGVGSGFQTSTLAAQTVLSRTDIPIGLALTFFMQQLGGSVFIAVGQNIFSGKLVKSLSNVGGLNPQVIVNTGATNLRNIVPSSELTTVIAAYSSALTRVFVLTTVLSCCMVLGALAVEWKSIKGKKVSGVSEKTVDTTSEHGESEP